MPISRVEQRPVSHLLYLHGFRSSPRSAKAQKLAAWMAAHRPDVQLWCPKLPPSPREAMALLQAGTADWPAAASAVVGSSLGGFYAHVLAETPARSEWRVGLINPAVNPARDLAREVGEQVGWHETTERFVFEPGFVDALREMAPRPPSNRARYLPIIATGDELLDWREMAAHFAGAPMCIVPGSDHALPDFETHLPRLLRHLSLTPETV